MTGAERIAAERKRQIEIEGWTTEHDTQHTDESLGLAAACYSSPVPIFVHEHCGPHHHFMDPWPWSGGWDKRGKHDRIRQLEIAGALCAAEIDRLIANQANSADDEDPCQRCWDGHEKVCDDCYEDKE